MSLENKRLLVKNSKSILKKFFQKIPDNHRYLDIFNLTEIMLYFVIKYFFKKLKLNKSMPKIKLPLNLICLVRYYLLLFQKKSESLRN